MAIQDDVQQYLALKQQAEALDVELRALAHRIMPQMWEAGLDEHRISPELGKLKIETKTTRTLQAARLLAAGVSAEVIKDATTESVSAPFLKWYKPRKSGEPVDATGEA